VPLDVVGGCTDHLRVVLELPQPTVAAGAQEGSHRAGDVVVVDVPRRHVPADGAEPTLSVEHGTGVLRCDPVPAAKVLGAFAAHRSADPGPLGVATARAQDSRKAQPSRERGCA
jgi:hypothetical protein